MFKNKQSTERFLQYQEYLKENTTTIAGTKEQIVQLNKESVALDDERESNINQYYMSENQRSFRNRIKSGSFETPEELYFLPEETNDNVESIIDHRKLQSIEEQSVQSVQEQKEEVKKPEEINRNNNFWQNFCCCGDTGANPDAYKKSSQEKSR